MSFVANHANDGNVSFDVQILSVVQSTLSTTRVFVADLTFSAGSVMTEYVIHVTDATTDVQVQAIFDGLAVAAQDGQFGNFTVDNVHADTCESMFTP